jgi:hypothetical protein
MILKKEHVNKLINIVDQDLVLVEENEFSEGDVLILFNNSDKFGTIQCDVPNTYRSGFAKKMNFIEFPPRGLINAVFIDKDTVVFARGI